MHVIVVGAGIAGSSAARILRERGHAVTVVAEGRHPHSLAATAVLRQRWHRDPAEAAALNASLACYRSWGMPLVQGGLVTHFRTPGRPPRQDPDWALIDPATPLLAPDRTGEATEATARAVTLKDGTRLDGDAVVIAAGCGSPLSAAGRTTYGVTWIHSDPAVLANIELRVHHLAPYKSVFAGRAGGRARLGSSSAADPQKAAAQGRAMLERCHELGIVTTQRGWEPITGARLKTPQIVGRTHGVYYLTGLHRTGYALAPGYATALAERIEREC